MEWIAKKFDELTLNELYGILQLRAKVFVVEQNCPYQDMDDVDKHAWHLFAHLNGKVLSYARLIPPGINYPEASIGRVVVDPSLRGKELGKELMSAAIGKCETLFGTSHITISAQCYLKRFYNNCGFKEVGEEYMEDNIPHIKMKR